MSTNRRLRYQGRGFSYRRVGLRVTASYPADPVPTFAYAAHYVAGNLAGSNGQIINAWPNTGSGGSVFDLTANGSTLPTLLRGAGSNGTDCVRVPASAWFQTAATGPLAGNQDRVMWMVVKLTTSHNQDLLTLGSAQSGRGCGIYEYENSGGNSWWVYGYGNTIRGSSTGWVVLLWRGRVEGPDFGVYVRDNDTRQSGDTPPAAFVNTNAAAPLQVAKGVIFGTADTLDIAEVGIGTSFPTGQEWEALKARFPGLYALSL